MKVIQNAHLRDDPAYTLVDDHGNEFEEVHRYLRFMEICGKSPNTIRTYAYHLKLYYEFMEIREVGIKELFNDPALKPLDILSSFMLWLQYPKAYQGVMTIDGEKPIRSNQTVNLIMSAVLSFYEYLSDNNDIRELPVYRMQRTTYKYKTFLFELMKHESVHKKSMLLKPTVQKPVEAITRAQYSELLQLCNLRRDKILLAFLFEGGLRISEALGMHISDLTELDSGIVRIVPREDNANGARVKRYAGGVIKLPDYVIDLVIAYLNEDINSYDSEYLFLTLNGKNAGKPLQSDTVEKLFDRLSKDAGYHVTPHMLRHGFATEKLEAGWQMVDIQAYLRHRSIQSTQIYAAYSDELKKEKMREFLEGNTEKMDEIAEMIGAETDE